MVVRLSGQHRASALNESKALAIALNASRLLVSHFLEGPESP